MCDKVLLLLLNLDIPWEGQKATCFQLVKATHNIMHERFCFRASDLTSFGYPSLVLIGPMCV
jgi:hypothetical protein